MFSILYGGFEIGLAISMFFVVLILGLIGLSLPLVILFLICKYTYKSIYLMVENKKYKEMLKNEENSSKKL